MAWEGKKNRTHPHSSGVDTQLCVCMCVYIYIYEEISFSLEAFQCHRQPIARLPTEHGESRQVCASALNKREGRVRRCLYA